MAIARSGTCHYVVIVPEGADATRMCCPAAVHEESAPPRGLFAAVFGRRATLQVSDAGVTPNPGPTVPAVLRSEVSVNATGGAGEISFFIDRSLTARLVPGDEVHIIRTATGERGLSVLRGGHLEYAIGAVASLPLGEGIEARVAHDLIERMQAICRERDPEFTFPEWPVAVAVHGHRVLRLSGQRPVALASHVLVVEHGYVPGVPGAGPWALLYRDGACNEVAGLSSLALMAGPAGSPPSASRVERGDPMPSQVVAPTAASAG